MEKDRYFLISYNHTNGSGTVHLTSQGMPGQQFLIEYISTNYGFKQNSICIFNIFEFKNKIDYIDFTKTSPSQNNYRTLN